MIFSGSHAGLWVFFLNSWLDPQYFILIQYILFFSRIQLKISHLWNDSSTTFIHKKTRLMSYKYFMNISSTEFMISLFSIFLVYIFSVYFFKISLYFFFKKYLFKHLRVFKFTEEDILYVSATNHLDLPETTHKLSFIFTKKKKIKLLK